MMRFVKVCLTVACLSGGMLAGVAVAGEGALVQLPNMPEGFQEWKAVTLLAFISVTALLLGSGAVGVMFKVLVKQQVVAVENAKAQQAMISELAEGRTLLRAHLDELKLTNGNMMALTVAVKTRPCHDEHYLQYLREKHEQDM